jgi:hypothetical protein
MLAIQVVDTERGKGEKEASVKAARGKVGRIKKNWRTVPRE